MHRRVKEQIQCPFFLLSCLNVSVYKANDQINIITVGGRGGAAAAAGEVV